MSKRSKPRRYAHPLAIPEGGALYVPPGVGVPRIDNPDGNKPKRIPNPDYVPAGVEIAGRFYQGGEAIGRGPELLENLDALSQDEAEYLLTLLHDDRRQAVKDFTGRRTSPPKNYYPRQVGKAPPGGDLEAVKGERNQLHLPDEAAEYLTPPELEGVEKTAQVRKFIDVFNRSVPVEQIAVGAKLGGAKRGWYSDAAKVITGLFGSRAPAFAALLAATSPVKAVGQNLNNALAIWAEWLEYRAAVPREPTVGQVQSWIQDRLVPSLEGQGYTMETEYGNLLRALTMSEPGAERLLSGPKVNSFRQNLLGDLVPVTNDTWAAAFADVLQKDIAGKSVKDDYGNRSSYAGGYAALAAKTRMAAEHLNADLRPGEKPWTPAEVQETTWSVFRALAHSMGKGRHDARQRAKRDKLNPYDQAALIPDARRALDELTNRDVHGNADFSTLLVRAVTDPQSRLEQRAGQSLVRLGYGAAVKALARRSEAARRPESALAGRATEALGPGEYPVALDIARQAAMSQGRFDNDVAQLSRRGRPQRYAIGGRPVIPRRQFAPETFYPEEQAILDRLVESADQDVAEMARVAVQERDPYAVFMLHDALLDAGLIKDANTVRQLVSYLARRESEANTWDVNLRRIRRTDQAGDQTRAAGGDSNAVAQARDDELSRASIDEYMAARPDVPGRERLSKHKGVARRAGTGALRYAGRPRKRHYAIDGRRPAHARQFHPHDFLDEELSVIDALRNNHDQDVREMAEAASRGNMAALFMLHDALLDSGQEKHASTIRPMMGYVVGPTLPHDVLHQAHDAGVAAREAVEGEGGDAVSGHEAAQNARYDVRINEFMAARPDLPNDHPHKPRASQAKLNKSARRARAGGRVRYASQTEANLSFEDAFGRSQSADAALYKDYADQMTAKVGLKGKSAIGVGDWEDGAEQSVLTEIPEAADLDRLRYVGAWQGLTGNQRAVLVFAPEASAKDSLYQIDVPETDAAKVRAELTKAGVPYRTIVPGQNGTKVVVYDQGRSLRNNVSMFAERYRAPVRETVGRGEYVGGGSRADARAKYRQVIAEYEARTGRRGGGEVRA